MHRNDTHTYEGIVDAQSMASCAVLKGPGHSPARMVPASSMRSVAASQPSSLQHTTQVPLSEIPPEDILFFPAATGCRCYAYMCMMHPQ